MNARSWSLVAALAFGAARAFAGDAEVDWKEIVALDAGPQQQPASFEAMRTLTLTHLALQEKALRSFLVAHPEDAHAFEARLRLAQVARRAVRA